MQNFFKLFVLESQSHTSQPKMLCLDYNEDAVLVKEVTWSVGSSVSMGSSLSLTSSFDGIAVFSAPTIADVDAIDRVKCSDFVERACICTVAWNGLFVDLWRASHRDSPKRFNRWSSVYNIGPEQTIRHFRSIVPFDCI